MNKRGALSLIILLCFWTVINSTASAKYQEQGGAKHSSPFVLPAVKRDWLLNGLQLITLEQPGTGTVRAQLRINSGSVFDLAGKAGLGDLTATMLLKGGGGWNAKTVSDTVEQLGLSVKINTDWDSTDIVVTGPADTLDTIFDLLGRLVISPTFDQKEFDSIKADRLAQIKAVNVDAAEEVSRKAAEALFGSHPFGRALRGTTESIAQITRQDLLYFHGRFYIANNSELVVTGDATSDQVTRLARTKLGAWKKAEKVPPTFRAPEQANTRRIFLLDRPQAESARAVIAQIGFSRKAEDFYAAAILAELFEQSSARVSAAIPGSQIKTKFEPRLIPGLIQVEVKSSVTDIPALITSILEEMARLQSSQPSIEDVERAKARIIANMSDRLKSSEGMASVILDIESYGLGRDYLINYAEKIGKVSPSDVQRAAQNYLKPQSVVAVIAAPASMNQEPLKKIGTLTTLK